MGLCLTLVLAVVLSSRPSVAPASGAASPTAASSQVADQSAAESPTTTTVPAQVDGSIDNILRRPLQADASPSMQTYSVQPGNTLDGIAHRFGLAVTTVYWANRATLPDPQRLRPGQTLVIPPIDGLVIVVGNNDTLESIAIKYGVASQDIVDANDLYDPTLRVGQTLIVPGAETPPLPKSKPATTSGGSSGSTAWTGRLAWPVPGHKQITQRFGCTGVASEPSYDNCRHFHDAIDIGAPEGSSVVAASGGTVIYAGWKLSGSDGFGGGLVVWISHGGRLYTTYNHLSAESLKVGQSVKAGQRIGSVGMTGNASGPHLHFETWACYPWTGGTIGCARNPLSYTR